MSAYLRSTAALNISQIPDKEAGSFHVLEHGEVCIIFVYECLLCPRVSSLLRIIPRIRNECVMVNLF